jgi:hypothetical protein
MQSIGPGQAFGHREQRSVGGGRLGAQVGEMAGEVRPRVDLEQEAGDFEMRHDAVDDFLEPLGLIRHAIGERLGLGQFIGVLGCGE